VLFPVFSFDRSNEVHLSPSDLGLALQTGVLLHKSTLHLTDISTVLIFPHKTTSLLDQILLDQTFLGAPSEQLKNCFLLCINTNRVIAVGKKLVCCFLHLGLLQCSSLFQCEYQNNV